MNLETIKQTTIRKASRFGLKVKEKSPEILIGAGVAAIIGGTVAAAKATPKAQIARQYHAERIDDIKEVYEDSKENGNKVPGPNGTDVLYTDEDYRRDITIVSFQRAVEYFKIYAPAATLTGLGIACMLGAHNIMKKRNVALLATYTAVDQSFKDYRERVVEEYGEEKDREFRFGTKVEEIEKEVINPETNRKNKKKEKIHTLNDVDKEKLSNISQYARLFDETNQNWNPIPSYNKMFLKAQQTYANDLLQARGHVFLNDVYDMLGMERSSEGQIVGWVAGEEGKDNYVDFGMFDVTKNSRRAAFINEDEHSVMLDFNVDGVIYDLI